MLQATGCGRTGDSELVVATSLGPEESDRLAATFLDWAGPQLEPGAPYPRVRWVRPADGGEPARLLERGLPADVVLGGPAASFQRLTDAGRLEPFPSERDAAWRLHRSTSLGIARRAADPPSDALAAFALDDPRVDPLSRELCLRLLRSRGWAAGYRGLLRVAGQSPQIGRRSHQALARLERGEVRGAPALGEGLPAGIVLDRIDGEAQWVEGVGLVRGAPHAKLARLFLAFLAERGEAATPPSGTGDDPRLADVLLADLLGATLVDAQRELVAAESALARAGHPARAEAWMVAPPWPPASVAKLAAADPTGSLVESLAQQIAPDLDVRTWLLESWRSSRGAIDEALLAELAGAVDGRLAAEPRFREWICAEWRAWARQRYRRVVRELERGGP